MMQRHICKTNSSKVPHLEESCVEKTDGLMVVVIIHIYPCTVFLWSTRLIINQILDLEEDNAIAMKELSSLRHCRILD
jgi:hypothetical protein